MKLVPGVVYEIIHANQIFDATFSRTEIDQKVWLVFVCNGQEYFIEATAIKYHWPDVGEFKIDEKSPKYSVGDIKVDLLRAGVDLTDKTCLHFSNFDEAGCVRAIEWLMKNAPWLDSKAVFAQVEAGYLV